MTFFCHHKLKQSTIRSACLTTITLIIVFNMSAHFVEIRNLSLFTSSLFGASFVGMSQKHRINELTLLASSILYTLIFVFLYPTLLGLGGSLGFCAFISCSAILLIKKIKRLKKHKKKN